MKKIFYLFCLFTFITAINLQAQDTSPADSIYALADSVKYKGDFTKLLVKNLKYPYEAFKRDIQGKVILRFVVEKDGSISNLTVIQSIYPDLDAEAMRVMQLTNGQWIPATLNGQPVRSWKYQQISFKFYIEEEDTPRRKKK